jgi:hypothetical protein
MPSDEQEPQRRRRRSPARLIIVVGGILALEAVVIIGAMLLVGGPEEEQIVEILVLDGKLPNNKSGVTYLYDTEIYVQVKKRYADQVAEELSRFRNEIKSEITAVWRTAEPRHFQEPRLESLTRRVQSMLSDRFGVDEQHDEPIISKCVIVMGMGFRIDS